MLTNLAEKLVTIKRNTTSNYASASNSKTVQDELKCAHDILKRAFVFQNDFRTPPTMKSTFSGYQASCELEKKTRNNLIYEPLFHLTMGLHREGEHTTPLQDPPAVKFDVSPCGH